MTSLSLRHFTPAVASIGLATAKRLRALGDGPADTVVAGTERLRAALATDDIGLRSRRAGDDTQLPRMGRRLSEVTRSRRSSNDADRLRKFLARFGLDWKTVSRRGRAYTEDQC